MSAQIAANGTFEQRVCEVGSATATSSDTETSMQTIDARGYSLISISAKNAGAQTVTVNVYGYNDAAFADETTAAVGSLIAAKTTDVTAAAAGLIYIGSTAITTAMNAVFPYYRIKLVNKTLASGHASATTVYWCLKNT